MANLTKRPAKKASKKLSPGVMRLLGLAPSEYGDPTQFALRPTAAPRPSLLTIRAIEKAFLRLKAKRTVIY